MTDTHSPSPPLPLEQRVRHPTLWFQDGTLVISTKSIIFKVYRGILIKHSEFFRRMFHLPQPASEPTFEGVPVVEFYEDPEDVAYFLNALHDPSCFETDAWKQTSSVKALLRLSTKYEVEWMQRKIITHLALRYPYTLINFSARKANEFVALSLGPDIIPLAHETQALILLPVALYEIAIAPPSTWSGFSFETMCLVSCGRQKLQEALFQHIGNILKEKPPAPSACTQGGCMGFKNKFFASPTWEAWMKEPDVLNFVIDHRWFRELNVCKVCEGWFSRQVVRESRVLWVNLPSYFDLPPWSTLKEMCGIQGKDDDEPEIDTAGAVGRNVTGNVDMNNVLRLQARRLAQLRDMGVLFREVDDPFRADGQLIEAFMQQIEQRQRRW